MPHTDFVRLGRRLRVLLQEAALNQGALFVGPQDGWITGNAYNTQIYNGSAPVEVAEPLRLARLLLADVDADPTSRQALAELLLSLVSPETAGVIAQLLIDQRMLHAFPVDDADAKTLQSLNEGIAHRIALDAATITDDQVFEIQDIAAKTLAKHAPPPRDENAEYLTDLEWNSTPQVVNAAWALERMANFLGYLRVRRDILEGENPELNTDKEALVSRFRELGFAGPLEALLQKIDAAFAGASDEFDFSAVMVLVRGTLEQVVDQSARHDAASVNVDTSTLGDPPVRFKRTVSVLGTTGLLSPKEIEALQAFYNMISVEGAHAWGSAREQARLSKNMMIEWGRLVLDRVR